MLMSIESLAYFAKMIWEFLPHAHDMNTFTSQFYKIDIFQVSKASGILQDSDISREQLVYASLLDQCLTYQDQFHEL